jgi:hypothetical protein
LVQSSLLAQSLNEAELTQHVESIEDQAWLQNQLKSAGLVSFVRNGAMLPRVSGVDDRPMQGGVPFQSPPSLQVGFRLPNAGVEVTGMGIPTGVTLICGGGFHGKSTLLQTLQLGVYYKIPGDGREFCVTAPAAAKIRAEDGRNIQSVDISSFIRNLPFDKDTSNFSTADASGSTSQASNIVEVSCPPSFVAPHPRGGFSITVRALLHSLDSAFGRQERVVGMQPTCVRTMDFLSMSFRFARTPTCFPPSLFASFRSSLLRSRRLNWEQIAC